MNDSLLRFVGRWKKALARVAAIPFVFFGVGLYRAWIAVLFRYDAFPSITVFDYFLFEASIGVVCFAFAFAARRIVPIWSKRSIVVGTVLSMVGGSACIVLSGLAVPSIALKIVGLVLAGGGLASLILMWSEFYGSLNPMRVALYHALAIFVGEVVKWLFLGMSVPYLALFAIILPPISIACVKASMNRLPERDLPAASQGNAGFAFPWKPVLLMSVCTFAGAFGELPMQPLIPAGTAGAMIVTALVFFGVLSASKWFNFDTVYQLAFPLFIIGFIFVLPTIDTNPNIMAFCYDAGYTMLSMFIMIILSNITYRFGISAVWLNGIERGIRYIVEFIGWGFFAWMSANASLEVTDAVYTAIIFVMVVIFTAIFLTERGLSARWGISFTDDNKADSVQAAGRLALRVSHLSKAHSLSPREEEVLQLLARRETLAQIEQDLYVAHGTVKAHISHIYKKLDVHSKEELYSLLERPEKP